jgi:hypothetical protein
MSKGKMPGAIVSFDAEKLRAMIKEHWDGSMASYARYCRIDPAALNKMFKRGTCNVEMLYRISKGVRMPAYELLDRVALWRSAPHRCRARANLTLEQLSQKSGIGVSTIEGVEGGGDCCTFSAYCLAQALGVTIEEYFGYGA